MGQPENKLNDRIPGLCICSDRQMDRWTFGLMTLEQFSEVTILFAALVGN